MKIEKLFKVLVVGGSLMTGCAGAPPVADKMPEAPAEAPASAPEETPAEADKPAEDAKGEEGEDGTCAWF